jgi:hypothetical protein
VKYIRLIQELAVGECFNRYVLDKDLYELPDDGFIQVKDFRFNEKVF